MYKNVKIWSDYLYLSSLQPSCMLMLIDEKKYKKELKKYKKVRSIQIIKRQSYFC